MSGNYPPNQSPPGGYPPPPPGGYPPPPPGGYPPPQGGYPPPGNQYGIPPPPPGGYGAPPPKKGHTLLWVLGGCATLIVIGTVAFFVISYFIVSKAKQAAKDAGFDTKLIQEKPALAAAKAVIAMNKDLELVSSDDDKGLLTVRNKQTGEIITISADDANKGKLSFKQNGKDVGSFEVHTDNPSIEVKGDKGSAQIGPGITDAPPAWIPLYPGAVISWDYSAHDKSAGTSHGSFHFLTSDAPEKVVSFYSDALKRSGLTVNVNGVVTAESKTGYLNAAQDARGRNFNLAVTPQTGSSRMVSIVFLGED